MERIKQFEIIFSNNHNCVFYPGQLLQGHVILETHAPVMTRGKKLQLIAAYMQYALMFYIKLYSSK